jgi:hypothetical protein
LLLYFHCALQNLILSSIFNTMEQYEYGPSVRSHMNKQSTLSSKKQLLLKGFYILFLLECLAMCLLILFLFPFEITSGFSHQLHLFSQLFNYLIISMIGSVFVFSVLFPGEKVSKTASISKQHCHPSHSLRSPSPLRSQYDPHNDTTNPVSASYYKRFSPRA